MSARLTLRHLRYFVAVATELNFRRAAERLGVSQPPLSRQIKELEDIVGAPLLERDTQRVKLTAAGLDFMESARALLAGADTLVEGIRGRHRKPVLAFASSLTVTARQAQQFTALLARQFGDDAFSLTVDVRSPQIAEDLRSGRLAGALVSLPVNLGSCRSESAFTDPLLAALPSSHPAARRKTVRLADLTGLPLFWWSRSFNPAYHDLLKQLLAQNQLKPRFINVEPGQLLTLERIAHGDGFTLTNQSRERTRLPGLAYRPLVGADALSIQVVFAWNQQIPDELGRKISAAVRRQLPNPG